ncbi:hypothetical protein B0H10DRAFT_2236193 [Mycena sp. CBHHK59/15]|nr:hypothetical protein B0H10DRAFT_2236193 [Mycena sp. CBHHK59/15]
MSILVNSMRTSRVKISATNSQTVLSSGFVSSLSVPHPPGSSFTLTINGGPHGSFTTVLPCTISTSTPLDVCLGSDWTSRIREWWTRLGFVGDFNAADHLHAVDVARINSCHAPVVTMPVPSANPYLASMRSLASAIGSNGMPGSSQINGGGAHVHHPNRVYAHDVRTSAYGPSYHAYACDVPAHVML